MSSYEFSGQYANMEILSDKCSTKADIRNRKRHRIADHHGKKIGPALNPSQACVFYVATRF